jgi:diguanylate cyclase (GGDEF)-like protein
VDLDELHWLLAIVQSIDVGVVVFDRDYKIEVWNTFMENRSGLMPADVYHRSFFDVFPEVKEDWFRHKAESVATLGTPAFTVWEQRPYLVRFKNYQPITGQEDFMYQNTTLLPLRSVNSQIGHICLIIYDVTSVAVNRRQMQRLNEQLQHLSTTDRLTQLHNRGHWEECLQHEYARHRRYGSQASLVMFDIDHFKRINDSYGHYVGDKVIEQVASIVRSHVRDTDIAGRYGGEEFVILLPDTDKQGAACFAERLRRMVSETTVMHEEQAIRFTISLGVADLSEQCDGHKTLIVRADTALYDSKRNGRDRVTLFQRTTSP